jgi:hypothetical protein
MDMSVILTAAGTVVAIVGSNIALISWLRSDMKSFETKIDGWKDEINKEMKDFHGRLCSLESRWHNDQKPKTDP